MGACNSCRALTESGERCQNADTCWLAAERLDNVAVNPLTLRRSVDMWSTVRRLPINLPRLICSASKS